MVALRPDLCYNTEKGSSDPLTKERPIMLKYPCLVLDHDDTVVQSESTVNYPFFVDFLKEHRPGMTITEHEYISGCFHPGYIEMCRQRFAFSDEELLTEYTAWKEHIRHHIPDPYPGIGALSYESARYHDYNLLMVLCMMTGILVILCNLIGQIINEKIDPRIKANEVVETSEVSKV